MKTSLAVICSLLGAQAIKINQPATTGTAATAATSSTGGYNGPATTAGTHDASSTAATAGTHDASSTGGYNGPNTGTCATGGYCGPPAGDMNHTAAGNYTDPSSMQPHCPPGMHVVIEDASDPNAPAWHCDGAMTHPGDNGGNSTMPDHGSSGPPCTAATCGAMPTNTPQCPPDMHIQHGNPNDPNDWYCEMNDQSPQDEARQNAQGFFQMCDADHDALLTKKEVRSCIKKMRQMGGKMMKMQRASLKVQGKMMKWQNQHMKTIANTVYNGVAKANPTSKNGVTIGMMEAWMQDNMQQVEELMNVQPPQELEDEMNKIQNEMGSMNGGMPGGDGPNGPPATTSV